MFPMTFPRISQDDQTWSPGQHATGGRSGPCGALHGPRRSQRSFQGAVDDLGESLNFDHRMEGEANLWMDFT